MSSGKTEEDLNTSVGELAILMNDTFTSCVRNYEALLPYIEKKGTTPKIYHKLVQINILLNKLNEELVGLRVDYVTVSSYEQRIETVLSGGGRKRKSSDASLLGSHEIKSIKTELPFSNNPKCSIASSETAVNFQSDKLMSMDTKEARYTQVKKSVDFLETPVITQTSSDTMKNADTICFIGDDESASVAERFVGDNACNKPANTITQRESNELFVPLQNVECEICIQEECETSCYIRDEDHDTYRGLEGDVPISSFSYRANSPFNSTESAMLLESRLNSSNKEKEGAPRSPKRYKNEVVNIKNSGKQCNAKKNIYGVITQNGKFKCTLCNRELLDYNSVKGHVKGKKHKSKVMTAKKNSCSKMSEVPSNAYESKVPVAILSDVPCSLDESLEIVEDRYQVVSMKHAVRLSDLWKYFDARFHINKKFFKIHLGQVACYLCNEQLGRYVLDVKEHIYKYRHLRRINILTDIELENKLSNKQLLDVPDFLEGVIPMTQFSLKANGFFCNVCNCFCQNELVLSHITGVGHEKALKGMKEKQCRDNKHNINK